MKNFAKFWVMILFGFSAGFWLLPSWAEEPLGVISAKIALKKQSENNIISFKIWPQNIVLKDKTAIVYYLIDLSLENKDKEKSTATYRIIHTWFNENGNWKILGGMSAKK